MSRLSANNAERRCRGCKTKWTVNAAGLCTDCCGGPCSQNEPIEGETVPKKDRTLAVAPEAVKFVAVPTRPRCGGGFRVLRANIK